MTWLEITYIQVREVTMLLQGMALLCQSRPVGDVTIETQSDWGYSLGMAEWKGATGVIAGKKPDSLTPWEK